MSSKPALGLFLYPDFITPDEEAQLLTTISAYMPTKSKLNVAQRNAIVRFGVPGPFTVLDRHIPAPFAALCDKLTLAGYTPLTPNAITINEYYAGQIIAPHIDPPKLGPIISVLSLAAPAVMVFTKKDAADLAIKLPARSLVQMRDSIRYDWRHEIRPVKALRYSIVFRHTDDD